MLSFEDHTVDLIIISSITILAAYFIIRFRIRKKRLRGILENTYFFDLNYIPTCKERASHGYPHLTIYFQTRADLTIAREKGLNNKLLLELKNLFSNIQEYWPGNSVDFEVLD